MGGTEHLCDQRNEHNYKPDGKSVPCQLCMGTQAGFAFSLNSVGWIFFVSLPTLGFLKCGGQQSWESTGCLVSQGSEAVAAMSRCLGRGTGNSWQTTSMQIRGQSGAAGLVWAGGKETGFLLSFGLV